jgi:hypothetical protein
VCAGGGGEGDSPDKDLNYMISLKLEGKPTGRAMAWTKGYCLLTAYIIKQVTKCLVLHHTVITTQHPAYCLPHS